MSSLRTVSSILGILAAVCLVLVQFLPWGGVEAGGFGGSAESKAYTWRTEGSFSGFGFSGSEKESWYSSDLEDDGEVPAEVAQIRIAIPVLLAGLALAAIGGILGITMRGPASGILVLLGGILAIVGTAMFAMAVDSLYDSDQDWGSSFYLAISASVLGLVGGILGVVPGARNA
jgi:hypothetical protein